MYSLLYGCVLGHALFKGPDTFKHNYPLVHPTKLRRSTSLWQEPYAAEAASQIAMWITVASDEFPTLQWEVLAENVLAHYVPGTHHIALNLVHSNGFFAEPHQLRLTLLHELLHAFEFGGENITEIETAWEASFDSSMPAITNYHWDTNAQGFHKRTFLPADKEVMQPYLSQYSFLSLPSLVATTKELRHACERDSDCGTRKRCYISSDLWVGTCEMVTKQDEGNERVLAIAISVAAIAFGVVAVFISS